jgi:uncharacterized protein DUF3881
MNQSIDNLSQVSAVEPHGGTVMTELFDAVGFEVADEEAYNLLAEYTEASGERSYTQREDATMHGRCLKAGDGIEVWSILYERGDKLYYADCRPGFRSRYVHKIEPWELIEYEEDGEAIIRGMSCGTSLLFELQNLTEAEPHLFREIELSVALAGIAYSCQIHPPAAPGSPQRMRYRFELTEPMRDSNIENCESDYRVRGRLLAVRELRNPVTQAALLWLYVDAGSIQLELITSKRRMRGRPKIGAVVTAGIWLQGHVLDAADIWARYEGVDRQSEPSDFWAQLRREN